MPAGGAGPDRLCRHSVLQTSASCTQASRAPPALYCPPFGITNISKLHLRFPLCGLLLHGPPFGITNISKLHGSTALGWQGCKNRHSVLQTSASCTACYLYRLALELPPFGITNISKLHNRWSHGSLHGFRFRHSVLQTSASCTGGADVCAEWCASAIRYYKHQQVALCLSRPILQKPRRHSVLQTSASCTLSKKCTKR